MRKHLFVFGLLLLGPSSFAAPAPTRQLSEADGAFTYVVSERAPTLYMISRDLYGSDRAWRELAEWNHLSAPFALTKGQILKVERAPTIDDAAADQTLARAYAKIGDEAMAARFAERAPAADVPPVAEPAPAVTPPVVTAPATPAPVEAAPAEPVKPEAPAVETPPAPEAVVESRPAPTKDIAPRPLELERLLPTPKPKEEASAYEYHVGLTLSALRLDYKRDGSNFRNQLNSRVNPGVAAGIAYRLSRVATLEIEAGLEHLEFESAEDQALEHSTQNLLEFGVKPSYEFLDGFTMYAGFTAAQRPFARTTTTGLEIDPVLLPEVTLGTKVGVLNTPRVRMWLLAEGLYAFMVHKAPFSVKEGTGYAFGFGVDVPVGEALLTFAPRFRTFGEDTSGAAGANTGVTGDLYVTW